MAIQQWFQGAIPTETGKLSILRSLFNDLSGEIATKLWPLILVHIMTLHDNLLTGSIPIVPHVFVFCGSWLMRVDPS